MFKEKEFSDVLQKIISAYDSITEFSEASEVNRTYLSKYINKKLDNPPTPKILEKIADNSKSITTYEELMQICGYTEESIEEVCYSIFTKLTEKYGQPAEFSPSAATWKDDNVTMSLEHPLTLKYIDNKIYKNTQNYNNVPISPTETTREMFLDEL